MSTQKNLIKRKIRNGFRSKKQDRGKGRAVSIELKKLVNDGIEAGIPIKDIASISNYSISAIRMWLNQIKSTSESNSGVRILPVSGPDRASISKKRTPVFMLRIWKFDIELYSGIGVYQ